MGNFGNEFVVVTNWPQGREPPPAVVTRRVREVAGAAESKFLYFHPATYPILALDPATGVDLLPRVQLSGFGEAHALIFSESQALWFAREAVLQLSPGVVVIIRGSLKQTRE